MHILKNTKQTLEVTFDQGDADGDVAVVVTDAAGTQVATGNATLDADGRYTFDLAAQADVASLTVRWSGEWAAAAQSVETHAEIVGAFLFTVADLRDFNDRKLADDTDYPDALIAEKRDTITDYFEQVCNVSFIPRFARDVLEGENRQTLWLMKRRPSRLLSVTADGTEFDADAIAEVDVYDSGKLWRPQVWPWNPGNRRNVVVEYEYGYQVVPLKIREAAMVLARYELITSDLSDRTIAVNTELGNVRLSVPGEKYPTGIPVVDTALCQYDETRDLEAF
jgi:hypothetical protein